jgi:hypothetical protein
MTGIKNGIHRSSNVKNLSLRHAITSEESLRALLMAARKSTVHVK